MQKKLEITGVFGVALVEWKYIDQKRSDVVTNASRRVMGEDGKVTYVSVEFNYENPHKFSEHNRQTLTEQQVRNLMQ